MTGGGTFLYRPGHKHRCAPPDPGEEVRAHLPIGTVWQCLRGEPTCGKRWRVAHIDDAFGGHLGWVRRRLPWRPIFGVEHPSAGEDSTEVRR